MNKIFNRNHCFLKISNKSELPAIEGVKLHRLPKPFSKCKHEKEQILQIGVVNWCVNNVNAHNVMSVIGISLDSDNFFRMFNEFLIWTVRSTYFTIYCIANGWKYLADLWKAETVPYWKIFTSCGNIWAV